MALFRQYAKFVSVNFISGSCLVMIDLCENKNTGCREIGWNFASLNVSYPEKESGLCSLTNK